jgi:hypothetical protein
VSGDGTRIGLRYNFTKARGIQRTNLPGTCLYCGARLRAAKSYLLNGRGDYGDNAFCGLRCGYSFGVVLASLGQRLAPRNDEKGATQ